MKEAIPTLHEEMLGTNPEKFAVAVNEVPKLKGAGRGFHSSTSHLNLSRFCLANLATTHIERRERERRFRVYKRH